MSMTETRSGRGLILLVRLRPRVAIPFLMMMVFCKIGHIEPKGDLFEHMRDAH